ncbi:WecB/TagA/CpsF family glycosyltransferase [Patescibacteria group bacterium]|nr:WecB/TagA/CpsF family glycosyltransferase [Patescibacteria group bacterium]
MLIYLEKKPFIIGKFDQVIYFLHKQITKHSPTQIILPCSLNDLSIDQVSDVYKGVDYFTSDSMFLTYFFRLKYHMRIERVYGPDLLKTFLALEQKNSSSKKHYFLAADKQVANKLSRLLTQKYPKLKTKVEFLPRDISAQAEQQQLKNILQTKPAIIWLGVGSPKQIELSNWLKQHSHGIKIFCVGAAFDFITGQKKQAPLWMQQSGLEWLFRLITEPKRLWKRYLVTIPKFLVLIIIKKIFKKSKQI